MLDAANRCTNMLSKGSTFHCVPTAYNAYVRSPASHPPGYPKPFRVLDTVNSLCRCCVSVLAGLWKSSCADVQGHFALGDGAQFTLQLLLREHADLQPPPRAYVGGQPLVALHLVLPQLRLLQELHLQQ